MAGPERIVVARAGVVTPVGQDLDAFWSALLTGASGISTIERFFVGDLRVGRGGEIKKLARVRDWTGVPECRATRLLVAAAEDLGGRRELGAVGVDPARLGVVVGTALGGVEEGERALAGDGRRRRLRDALYDGPGENLARWLGARGPVLTVSTACASGATALALGADLLRQGRADAVVAGGYDPLCRFVMRGFDALRALTRDEVRPFDRRRAGLLLGEGAALVLLLRARDAGPRRLGVLLGYGSASEAHHVSAPDPEGRGLARAIRAALRQAGVAADEVDLVSAHGTGTPQNDPAETRALRHALGPRAGRVPVNAIKSGLGHTMGAAATFEAIMCLLAARHGVIPPTRGLEEPDPACDLDLVYGAPRTGRPRVCLSTSLGFGGASAALVLGEAG